MRRKLVFCSMCMISFLPYFFLSRNAFFPCLPQSQLTSCLGRSHLQHSFRHKKEITKRVNFFRNNISVFCSDRRCEREPISSQFRFYSCSLCKGNVLVSLKHFDDIITYSSNLMFYIPCASFVRSHVLLYI